MEKREGLKNGDRIKLRRQQRQQLPKGQLILTPEGLSNEISEFYNSGQNFVKILIKEVSDQ